LAKTANSPAHPVVAAINQMIGAKRMTFLYCDVREAAGVQFRVIFSDLLS
jgi:hypothetical protein